MSHCEGCVMCETDGVPVEAATWLDWPWLKKRTVPRHRTDPLRNRRRPVRHGSDPKDPGPDVILMRNGRRHRVRRGNPPAPRPAIDVVGGDPVGTGFLHMGVSDRKSTHGHTRGHRGTPR